MAHNNQPVGQPFGSEQALLSRLMHCHRQGRSVVFLVGAPLSAPQPPETRGVPGVGGIIDLIRACYQDSPRDLADFERQTQGSGNLYQSAFEHLILHRGLDAANAVVREAVLLARKSRPATPLPERMGNDLHTFCEQLETDVGGWTLPLGCAALGELAARSPSIFGRCVLTTNFDPLLQVAISKAGGRFLRTVLDRDGHLGQTDGDGCHIVHLHGHWYRADTLHTAVQLQQQRPKLANSLKKLLAEKTVVVLAYGGWDDIFNRALRDIWMDEGAHPDVLWTFYCRSPEEVQTRYSRLLTQIKTGIDLGRINLYHSVDVHQLLPNLLNHLYTASPPSSPPGALTASVSTGPAPTSGHPVSSRPISPFRDIGRITDPSRFFDREELLSELFAALRTGQNISLVGDAAIGKSSILTMIKHWGPSRLGMAHAQILDIDMQVVDSDRDFYDRLCRQLSIQLCRGSELATRLEGKKFIICIDEIEKMNLAGRQRCFGRAVRTHLRGLADGADRPLTLVITSRRPLNALFPDEGGQTSPLYNICLPLQVRGFLPERAREFLRSRLSTTGVTFSTSEEDHLIEQSQGHPGQLQRLADGLFTRYVERP